MKIETQFCVFLENIPERTADICSSLENAGISILGLSISDTADYGVARLTVDDLHTARDILQESGYAFTEVSVISMEVSHSPGALAELLRTMTQEQIHIEYAYTTAADSVDRARVVIRADPLHHALDVLRKHYQLVVV